VNSASTNRHRSQTPHGPHKRTIEFPSIAGKEQVLPFGTAQGQDDKFL
jgi:hypothetical protein